MVSPYSSCLPDGAGRGGGRRSSEACLAPTDIHTPLHTGGQAWEPAPTFGLEYRGTILKSFGQPVNGVPVFPMPARDVWAGGFP